MGLLAKVWKAVKQLVSARYEAAFQRWGERSWLTAAVQDARFDADEATRKELVRRSRYWERNNAIVNRLTDLFEQFTVGANGLQLVPNSSDEDWNQSASAWWQGWCRYPDLTSLQPFSVVQSLLARSWFIDGEVFIYKTRSPKTNRPRIQIFEAHRCETPPDMRNREGLDIIDGVRIDPNTGRPISYFFSEDDKDSRTAQGQFQKKYTEISADNIIHLFEPCRPGMYRGLPFLYPVMNDLHDLDDLQMLEMRAAKDAASITNVITNATGEVDPQKMRRQRFNIQTQDQAGNAVTKETSEYYQTVLAGRTIALKTGEDIKQFQSTRPSVATRDYWEYLTSKVCAGVGISKLLVMPYSMQGTVTRADLDVATAFFRSRSQVIATACREIYLWVMGWAKTYDKSLDGAPQDWADLVIRPPRAPNVDVGRNSAAMLAELEAGTRTFQDIYAETGEDWRQQLRQKAEERLYIRKLAKELSQDGIELTPDEIAGTSTPTTPEPQSEGDVPIKKTQEDE